MGRFFLISFRKQLKINYMKLYNSQFRKSNKNYKIIRVKGRMLCVKR